MSERKTKPTTAEERAEMLCINGYAEGAGAYAEVAIERLVDDIADRDATIAALTARAEGAERDRGEVRAELRELRIEHEQSVAAHAELERRARELSEWCDRYGQEMAWSDGMKARNRALAELLPARDAEQPEGAKGGERG